MKILKTSPDNAHIAVLELAKPKSKNGTKVKDLSPQLRWPFPRP